MQPKEISRRTALKMLCSSAILLTSCRTLESFLEHPKEPTPTPEKKLTLEEFKEYLATIEGLADWEILSTLPVLNYYQKLFVEEKRPITEKDIGFNPILYLHYFAKAYEKTGGQKEALREEIIKIFQGKSDIPETGEEATPEILNELLAALPEDYEEKVQAKIEEAFDFMEESGCPELKEASIGLKNLIENQKLQIISIDFMCDEFEGQEICFALQTLLGEIEPNGSLSQGLIRVSPVSYYLTTEALAISLAKEYYGIVAREKLAKELLE